MTIYLLKMVMFQLQIVKYLEGNWFQICKFWWFSPDKWHDDPDSHDFTDDSIHVVADDDGDEKLWWWQLLSLSLLILLYLSIYYIYMYITRYIYTHILSALLLQFFLETCDLGWYSFTFLPFIIIMIEVGVTAMIVVS